MIKKLNYIFVVFLCALLIFSSIYVCNASASSKSFGDSDLSSARDCVDFSVYGLQQLGYSPTYQLYGDLNLVTDVLPWINNTGNGYAFYIQIHGEENLMIDSSCNTLEPSEVGGNWDLVFLDFSDSAANGNFANAFHTTGYSNRGFLGWDGDIYTTDARTFSYYFWTQHVTTASLASAAIFATSSVPGSNSAPIAYYGDTNYYGYAR